VLPAVVGDLRGCHADAQIAIGVTRLVARIARHSAARWPMHSGGDALDRDMVQVITLVYSVRA
jgi:hypothetical protein